MKAICSLKMLGTDYPATQCHIPEKDSQNSNFVNRILNNTDHCFVLEEHFGLDIC
jgi:hypothetical protein